MKINLLQIGKAFGTDVSLALAQSPAFAALHRWYQRAGQPDAVFAAGDQIDGFLAARGRPVVEPYAPGEAFSVPVVLGGRFVTVNTDLHADRHHQAVELIRSMALLVQKAPVWTKSHNEASGAAFSETLRSAAARAEGNALLLAGAVIANVELQGGLRLPRPGALWSVVSDCLDAAPGTHPAAASSESVMAKADMLGAVVVADAANGGRYLGSINKFAFRRAEAVERLVAQKATHAGFGPDSGPGGGR